MMIKSIFYALFFAILAGNTHAKEFQIKKTKSATEYGIIAGKNNAPIAIIFTTNIKESLTNLFSPIGENLSKAGFTILAIDVPCHGNDVKNGEDAGLTCWRKRAVHGDFFSEYTKKTSDVISNTISSSKDTRFIVAIGISRGGYMAFRAAAADSRINAIVGMAPVTDLQALSEFKGLTLNKQTFGLERWYDQLAKKATFLQIGNSDDRVGTQQAMNFLTGVVKAGGSNPVDATELITPNKGHATARHDLATQWVLSKAGYYGQNKSVVAAP